MSEEFLENIDLEEFDIPVFIDQEKEIEITIWVGASKKSPDFIYCDFDFDKFKEVSGEDLKNFKEYKLWFRYPSFNDNNVLLSNSLKYSVSNELELSPTKLSFDRICMLIKRWTFPKECNTDNLKGLSPIVGLVVGMALDNELKKLGLL